MQPTVIDLNLIMLTVTFRLNFVLKHLEGLIVIVVGIIYSILNTLFMWITWLDRFSGNANFFYFQTIVYNVFLASMYSQLFKAIDKKRKKYFNYF